MPVDKEALCKKIMSSENNTFTEWVERETEIFLRLQEEKNKENLTMVDCDYSKMALRDANELLAVFAAQGHSGLSAKLVISLFKRLASWKPLTPLTGEDDEWTPTAVADFQNKRLSSIFKNKEMFDGRAYDIEGILFEYPDGTRVTTKGSAQPIEFPYISKNEPIILQVDEDGECLNGWDKEGVYQDWLDAHE